MLDINFIRKNKEKIIKAAADKNIKINIEKIIDLDDKRKFLIQEINNLREKRNQIASQMKSGEKNKKLIENGREVKRMITEFEDKLKTVEKEFESLMAYVPQITSEDTPIGKDSNDNVVVKEFGNKPKFDFKIRDHIELGKMLDIIDLEKGAKVSGFRGYFLKNEGALLHFAVLFHALQTMISKGFVPMVTPTLVKKYFLFGTGFLPFGMDNLYKVGTAGKLELDKSKDEGTYLIGTSEVSLCGYYSDQIIDYKDLPIKICGVSQCYRSEVGDYGRDTRGIYRLHEFLKVEQVVICENDYKISNNWHEKLLEISKEILTSLGLPFRVIRICTGDMGAGKYRMYDIETWMPGRNSYGETHSDSNMGDWQARRLKIRYRDKDGKIKIAHTLNNTAIASPRILIPILENYQQKDGSVKIPKILQKWVGKEEIKPKS